MTVFTYKLCKAPPAAFLTRVLGPGARGTRGTATLVGWTALYALASAGLAVVVVDLLMGIVTGHPWALFGAGTLIVFTAAITTAALMALLGFAGIAVAIVAFVVLGNPTSGGSVPVQMLSGGYRFLADVLPNNAGTSQVHGIQYFDGNGTGHPLLVLALYAGAALAVCFAQAWRKDRAHTGKAATAPDLVPAH